MTQQRQPGCTAFGLFCRHPRLIQGVALISSLGVFSSGLVLAETDADTVVVPTKELPAAKSQSEAPVRRSTPAVVRPEPPVIERQETPVRRSVQSERRETPVRRSVQSERRETPVRRSVQSERQETPVRRSVQSERRETPVRRSTPAVVQKKRAIAPPRLSAPNLPSTAPSTRTRAKAPANDTSVYIDRTDYSVGATPPRYEGPGSVVLSERSTGCQSVLRQGQGVSGGVCGAPKPRRAVAQQRRPRSTPQMSVLVGQLKPPSKIGQSRPSVFIAPPQTPSGVSQVRQPVLIKRPILGKGQPVLHANAKSINAGPLPGSLNGLRVVQPTSRRGSFSISSQEALPSALPFYNPVTRLPKFPGNGNTNFIFPVSIPAPITSVFGWRIHPISGTQRFHSGTDIGAPLGTPVLAAYSGKVATASYLGGYGLAVILQHGQQATQETLYGHLSEIFVQPGDWVEQGTVIGRVGSTGNSTGPHLHFEWRALTSEGWVAVDSGTQLQQGLAQLLKSLQTAQSAPVPQS